MFGAVTTKPDATRNIVNRSVFIAVQEGDQTQLMLARKVRTHQSKQLVEFVEVHEGEEHTIELWPESIVIGKKIGERTVSHVFVGAANGKTRLLERDSSPMTFVADSPTVTARGIMLRLMVVGENDMVIGTPGEIVADKLFLGFRPVPAARPDDDAGPLLLPGAAAKPPDGEYVDLEAETPRTYVALQRAMMLQVGPWVSVKQAGELCRKMLDEPRLSEEAGDIRAAMRRLEAKFLERTTPTVSKVRRTQDRGQLGSTASDRMKAIGELYGLGSGGDGRGRGDRRDGRDDDRDDRSGRRRGRRDDSVTPERARPRQRREQRSGSQSSKRPRGRRDRSGSNSSSSSSTRGSSDGSDSPRRARRGARRARSVGRRRAGSEDRASSKSASPRRERSPARGTRSRRSPSPVGRERQRLDDITPRGVDPLDAAAVVFASATMRSAAQVERVPRAADRAGEPNLLTRYALAVRRVDKAAGGPGWTRCRPDSVEQLARWVERAAEQMVEAKRGGSASKSASRGSGSRRRGDSSRKRARRERSPSESEAEERPQLKLTQDAAWRAVESDTAEALNKAKAKLESVYRAAKETGDVAGATAGMGRELEGELQRALIADGVAAVGEVKRSRKVLPPEVAKLHSMLELKVAEALRKWCREVSVRQAKLTLEVARPLAKAVRTCQADYGAFVKVVRAVFSKDAVGSHGSAEELRTTWGLMLAGIEELARHLRFSVSAATQVNSVVGLMQQATKLSTQQLRQYVEAVVAEWRELAFDFRGGGEPPSMSEAVQRCDEWLRDSQRDAIAFEGGRRGAGNTPRGGKGGKGEKGGGSPAGGKGGRRSQEQQQGGEPSGRPPPLWPARPALPKEAFAKLGQEHKQKFGRICFFHCVQKDGCRFADCKAEHPASFPDGWAAMCQQCTGLQPSK